MNKLFTVLFLIAVFGIKTHAYTLDVSVDDEIKKKYTTVEIPVGQVSSASQNGGSSTSATTKTSTTPKGQLNYTQNNTNTTTPNISPNTVNKSSIKLPSGTKFCLKPNQKITNFLNVGSTLTFVSCAPLVKKNITIPTGTVFSGIITEKHPAQITGNGALVGLKITKMNYKKYDYSINAKVTKVNADNIFFNNIKGERKYIEGVKERVAKGKNFYQKSKQTSTSWAQKPLGKITSPLPKIVGGIGNAIYFVSSPVVAIGKKGGNVEIPAGAILEVKLLEAVYVYE